MDLDDGIVGWESQDDPLNPRYVLHEVSALALTETLQELPRESEVDPTSFRFPHRLPEVRDAVPTSIQEGIEAYSSAVLWYPPSSPRASPSLMKTSITRRNTLQPSRFLYLYSASPLARSSSPLSPKSMVAASSLTSPTSSSSPSTLAAPSRQI